MTNKETIRQILKLYISSIIIYGLGILIFRFLPYYKKLLNPITQNILFYIYIAYLVIAPIYYKFTVNQFSENKPLLFIRGIIRLFKEFKLKKKEKVAMLFMLVKVFYLPLLVQFFIGNFTSLIKWNSFQWYPFIFTLMFTIDTFVYAAAYAFEFKELKNVVKSVEPTFFGWFVALICYPPFNGWVGKYVAWGANDYVSFWNPTWTLIMRIIIVFLLFIYVAATVALGPKSSNLTNRGIVSRFPYNIIRHPAYISKNLLWWATLLPVIKWQFALGMTVWSLIYFFRAITEENHLSQDFDYVRYKWKVKYKFIPFVY